MIAAFMSQFKYPQGFLGGVAGWLMALKNRERNAWAVGLLDLQRSDHVLEIGFGPGWAIQQMAARATTGFVAGVDPSEVMVRQASRRNAAALRAGRVELRQSFNAPLPYGDARFDKVLAVNSMQFWPDALAGLQEVRRVLKPGGRVVITVQPMWAKTDAEARAVGVDLAEKLTQAGFQRVRLETLPLKPLVSSVIGIKI
jgi:ubiquinone/menaquinone biosynthesis C-methylase UbiE